MSATGTASEQIVEEVTAWPGVEVAPGRFGALALVVGRREIGHLHGDHAAHFAFPRGVRAELMEQGRVGPHPIDSPGLAARRIETSADVHEVIELMRLNYDRIVARDR
jgi:Family of unknown function (DUF5519)